MTTPRRRTVPLSPARQVIGDLVHFAHQVPSVPVQRRINVAAAREARDRATPRPSWVVLFTKAYATVAATTPELRRAYVGFPWPHLHEHECSIASVAVERQWRGEDAVFFAHLRAPEDQTLADLDAHLRRFKAAPVESIGLFRRALTVGRLPRPLRRLLWWVGLNVNGAKRAKRLGTFGVSVYSGLGAASLHPLSPLTTTLNYGVIDGRGDVDVRLIYDHRVMDGATVARALARLEVVMNQDIVAELHRLAGGPPAAAA
jgi:hypothetical protein